MTLGGGHGFLGLEGVMMLEIQFVGWARRHRGPWRPVAVVGTRDAAEQAALAWVGRRGWRAMSVVALLRGVVPVGGKAAPTVLRSNSASFGAL